MVDTESKCSTKEKILEAANKSGFNFEFRSKEIFEKNNYFTEINKILKYPNPEVFMEVDLSAAKSIGQYVLAECKGAASTSALILVKEKNLSGYKPIIEGLQINETNVSLAQFDSNQGELFSFTGYFFNLNNKDEFIKSSKHDEKNNFYKAQLQLSEAIRLLSLEENEKNRGNGTKKYIVPLIITNANIWMVNYEEKEPSVKKYKWVVHKVTTEGDISLSCNREMIYKYLVPVVNINHLDELILKIDNISISSCMISLKSELI